MLVVPEIGSVCQASSKRVSHGEAGIRADQLTHAVPVPAVEAFDIELHHFGQRRIYRASGFRRSRSGGQLRPAAIEGGLDPADRGVDELGGLLQGIIEHVFEKNAGTLLGWQARDEMFEGATKVKD